MGLGTVPFSAGTECTITMRWRQTLDDDSAIQNNQDGHRIANKTSLDLRLRTTTSIVRIAKEFDQSENTSMKSITV